jgi:hypothetical protein
MTKLYVIGDSFSAIEYKLLHSETTLPYPNYDYGASVHWPKQLADKLNCNIVNFSEAGVSQDYEWDKIYQARDLITPDDYLIVVITEPYRFWYLEDQPQASRPDLLVQDSILKRISEIADQFDRYINRDALAVLNLENRLGALSYMAHTRGWKTPLIVYAMSQIADVDRKFNNLEFAKGTLTEIAINEAGIGVSEEHYNNKIMKGIDPRYNHLTMSNHRILVDKLYNYFINNTPVDLTTGFLDTILTEQSLADPNFQHELSPGAMHWRKSIGKEWRLWRTFGKPLI